MARTRHVYPSNEVAQLWAMQSATDARVQRGNFYFNGATIYSYGSHFPIAKHVERNGEKAILFTSRSYSHTTSGHKSEVSRAILPGVPVFTVPRVDANEVESHVDTTGHETNVLAYRETIDSALIQFTRARCQWRKESTLSTARHAVEEVRAYASFFGLSVPVPETFVDIVLAMANGKKLSQEGLDRAATLCDMPTVATLTR